MTALFVVAVGAGQLYIQSAGSKFQATTRLLVQRRGAAFKEQARVRFDPAFLATQAEVIHSRPVVEKALAAFTPPSLADQDDSIAAVLKSIRVSPVEGAEVVGVVCTLETVEEAEQMLVAIIQSYRQHLEESKHSAEWQSLAMITEKELEVRQPLEDKQEEYLQFRRDNSFLGLGRETGKVYVEYLTNLGKGLVDTKLKRLKLENQLDQLTSSPNDVTLEAPFANDRVLKDADRRVDKIAQAVFVLRQNAERFGQLDQFESLQKELRETRQWEEELNGVYGDKFPLLRSARAQIESTTTHLSNMFTTIKGVLEHQLETIRENEQSLEILYAEEIQRTRKLEMLRLEEQQFVDAIERLQSVHDSILDEMHNRQLATATGQGSIFVEIMSPPKATARPVWPIKEVVFGICGCIGLMLGCGVAIIMSRFQKNKTVVEAGSDETSEVAADPESL